MKLIKGDISLVMLLNLAYLFCYIYTGILEFLYLLIFNIIILVIQIAYKNHKTEKERTELVRPIYEQNDYNKSLIESNEEYTNYDEDNYDDEEGSEYSDDEENYEDEELIEEVNEHHNNETEDYYEPISKKHIKADTNKNANKNYISIIIFIVLAVIGLILIFKNNIDKITIEPLNNYNEEANKLDDLKGEWVNIIQIEGGLYISTIFIYGDNRCGGMAATSTDIGIQVLGTYISTCHIRENKITFDDSINYYYNEEKNIIESMETGTSFVKTSTNPCTNIYAAC